MVAIADITRLMLGTFVRPPEETGTGAPRVEVVLAYVVRHPDGVLLFDTGLGDGRRGDRGVVPADPSAAARRAAGGRAVARRRRPGRRTATCTSTTAAATRCWPVGRSSASDASWPPRGRARLHRRRAGRPRRRDVRASSTARPRCCPACWSCRRPGTSTATSRSSCGATTARSCWPASRTSTPRTSPPTCSRSQARRAGVAEPLPVAPRRGSSGCSTSTRGGWCSPTTRRSGSRR